MPMKTKNALFTAITIFLLTAGMGCKEKENIICTCGVPDPLVNLTWLKEIKTNLENDPNIISSEIIMYSLEGQDYILVESHIDSAQDIPSTIYDCKRNEKYKCGGNQLYDNCSIFFSKAQKKNLLWEKN